MCDLKIVIFYLNKWDQKRKLKNTGKGKKKKLGENVVKANKTVKNISAVRPKAFWWATI